MESLLNFGFLLKDVSRLYSRNFERHAAQLELTLHQCRVLSYLSRNEGISQARLAYLTETDPMTLGRLLGRMEARGLLERRPDPDDRRVRRLYLRSSAAPLLRQIWRLSDLALAESLTGIRAGDRTKLIELMRRIHANLDTLLPGLAESGGGGRTPSRRRSGMSDS
jgi:DNA-binding MarR family transcriptional regulator